MTEPTFGQDFDDFLSEFIAAGVEFIVVGAHALAVHGYVRATGDLDVFVRPSPDNAARVINALRGFGAPIEAHRISTDDFQRAGMVYQIGLPPNRIDVLTELSGVSFESCESDAIHGTLGTNRVRFIGLQSQLQNKRATGRTKDVADAEFLEAIAKRRR